MTLEQLNKVLHTLSQQPEREKVLEFSFSLMEWLGVEANVNKTPQLIAPKTQKLKDFLVTGPNTVQPQLYRLSADNQNIRVRFAVLKKLKKEYLSQLVDNDPGAESYQNTPDALKPVTKAPYFIHFVTTGDYDKLVLIFNQGEQKRVINFRSRLTNTQYFKVVSQWHNAAKKVKPELSELLWKSLDIKEVNKEFYQQIKEHFDALIGILKQCGIDATENQLKQFAVRLIGRYIFCWFLREKGIIPNQLIKCETVQQTPDYYRTTLLRLFFDTLNTKVSERKWLTDVDEATRHLFEKIPYLNGGLFDESDEDRLFRDVHLDNWLIPFVTTLENYDFTVDESSSNYQQIAVDPEMLGRIFENLLASQAPETAKLANERKTFGAFYTPREVVDFMVKESLKIYLADKMGIDKDELSSAFSSNPVWSDKLSKRKQDADKALQQIKILDPACGSGAYPISVLHNLVALRELVGFYTNTYNLKKEILSNNIYGIDIMPMAIEIARLRAWLSLIVEEDYHPDKPKNNFGIDALPNLDFKFMQGNSLLETYEGLKLFDEKFLNNDNGNASNDILTKTRTKISHLQKQYLDLTASKQLTASKKLLLEKELKENNDLLKKIVNGKGVDVKGTLFATGEKALDIATRLKKLHIDYFNLSDKEEKKKRKADIEELEWSLIEATLTEYGKENKVKEVKRLKALNIKPYFIYKLNFPEVYDKGGFDIVIGNPPYVRQESIKELKPLLQHYKVYASSADLLVYFYELGYNQLNEDGILTLITSNKFMRANYGEKLRSFLKENTSLKTIIDFGDLPVFEALAYPVVIITQKRKDDTNVFRAVAIETEEELDGFANVYNEKSISITQQELDKSAWRIETSEKANILSKLSKVVTLLSDYVDSKYYRGITTGFNDAFIINEVTKNELIADDPKSSDVIKPFLRGRDIKRYCITNPNIYLLFIPWHFPLHNDASITGASPKAEQEFKKQYPAVYKHLKRFYLELSGRNKDETGIRYEWYALQRCAASYFEEFEKPKILMQGMMIEASYALDETGSYLNAPANFIASGDKYLLGLLNSKLLWWFLYNQTISIQQGYARIYMYQIEKLPIRSTDDNTRSRIEKLTDRIAQLKQKGQATTTYEKEIDVLVFHIYGLTYTEAAMIDPELTEDDFNKFTL